MKYLLSLPENATENFHVLNGKNPDDWFCTSDPRDARLGSGSGTTWLLEECRRSEKSEGDFEQWLAREKRILIHAGGQSRRLPAYASSGKIGIPVPIFRWARGQKLSQDLLSLQIPLLEKIVSAAPASCNTLIASGDVYITSSKSLPSIPEADVICFGLWVDSSLATRHGVFVSRRHSPETLDRMLQKPSLETLESLAAGHYFLMDIGLWLLSDKAVKLLREKSYANEKTLAFYDLYGDFGLALGENPAVRDEALNALSVKILPLPGGEFYHYGTSREMISSTLALQNKVYDQRLVMHKKIKPNPAIFTQNSQIDIGFHSQNENVWIENSYIGNGWQLESEHVITGVPQNRWNIRIPKGVCVDIVHAVGGGYIVRPYGINDAFKGGCAHPETCWMNRPFVQWLAENSVEPAHIEGDDTDIQKAKLFPLVHSVDEMESVLKWMIGTAETDAGKSIWMESSRFSADDLMQVASLPSLFGQREKLRRHDYKLLETNYEKSVFYQLNLEDVALQYTSLQLVAPECVAENADSMTHIHNRMLRSRCFSLQGNMEKAQDEEKQAFNFLRAGLTDALWGEKRHPRLDVYPDQIVWARSPVRIDLAGGWTDTPPYSLYSGGSVVNIAIELNGQPPLQVYVKPCVDSHIVLRSIDMGAVEIVSTYEQLVDYTQIGSPFSIPKAALALAGFAPGLTGKTYTSLHEQLKDFGSGIELTLLAAIPAGSGLGTSSILAATVLGALNDFCGLQWTKHEICTNTLVLEQMLTTGGGWQDQYGGVFHGVKLLESDAGFRQCPQVNWLPGFLFTDADYKACHLLYYTGITRVAKNILAEIVRGMFLNSSSHLSLLEEMKNHAADMAQCMQHGNFGRYGKLILKTWEQKKALDKGTNPDAVEDIIRRVKDYTSGYKLPGAGGGGYLYMVAKDAQAASHIRRVLTENPPNDKARFVNMALSDKGLQISRS